MSSFGLDKPFGVRHKIAVTETAGPTSYATGGFTVTLDGISNISFASVVITNNPGNKLATWSVSGNTVTIKVYTIAADTSSGAISATEDAAATDESSLTFAVFAVGY